jgi:glycine cleavage system H protein
MNIPSELRYTKDHEWAKLEGDVVTVGITDYAQGELGDVVFVELPEVGSEIEIEDTFGTIEAVKAVADLFSPVSGEVVETNTDILEDAPETINSDPYGDGWMVKIKLNDIGQFEALMTAEAYKELLG